MELGSCINVIDHNMTESSRSERADKMASNFDYKWYWGPWGDYVDLFAWHSI